MNFRVPLLFLVLAFGAAGVQAQSLFKCLQDGKTLYQAQPCPEAAKQSSVKAPSAAPAGAAGGGGAGSAQDVEATIAFMATYRACADAITMWRQEMAQPYEAWRQRNLATVTRIEQDAQLRARLAQQVAANRNGKAGMCRPVGLGLRGVKS